MSVVVRMEMPENCQRCELFSLCTGKCKNEVVRFDGQNIDKKDRRCMFICQLPEGHGRLIDADALNLDHKVEMAVEMAVDWKTAHMISNVVKYAPTIVPAEAQRKVYASDAVTPTDTPTDIPTVPAERSDT